MYSINISVVVPNYNHSKYLPQSLNAILQQSASPYEIIIIDDCSTDNSISIIKDFLDKHPNIKLIQNSNNLGVVANINHGLHSASGTHVLFAAADDWIEPTLIENATKDLQNSPQAGLWSSGSWVTYEDKPNIKLPARMHFPIKTPGYIDPKTAQKLLLDLESWFMGNTVILNREYLLLEGGFNPVLLSFADNFMYRILAHKYGCCFNPAKLSTWRVRRAGFAMSNNNNIDNQQKIISATMQLLNAEYKDLFDKNLKERTQRRLNFNLARSLWLINNAQMSAQLRQILTQYCTPAKFKWFWLVFFKLTNYLPGLKLKLGNILLFFLIRPFDFIPILMIYSHAIFAKLGIIRGKYTKQHSNTH